MQDTPVVDSYIYYEPSSTPDAHIAGMAATKLAYASRTTVELPSLASVDTTLQSRGVRYGNFADQSRTTALLKHVVRGHEGWAKLAADQKEALEMILLKIARIMNGDPDYADSWHDIAGYATLVEKRLTAGSSR